MMVVVEGVMLIVVSLSESEVQLRHGGSREPEPIVVDGARRCLCRDNPAS
jgi:hypothetical protein